MISGLIDDSCMVNNDNWSPTIENLDVGFGNGFSLHDEPIHPERGITAGQHELANNGSSKLCFTCVLLCLSTQDDLFKDLVLDTMNKHFSTNAVAVALWKNHVFCRDIITLLSTMLLNSVADTRFSDKMLKLLFHVIEVCPHGPADVLTFAFNQAIGIFEVEPLNFRVSLPSIRVLSGLICIFNTHRIALPGYISEFLLRITATWMANPPQQALFEYSWMVLELIKADLRVFGSLLNNIPVINALRNSTVPSITQNLLDSIYIVASTSISLLCEDTIAAINCRLCLELSTCVESKSIILLAMILKCSPKVCLGSSPASVELLLQHLNSCDDKTTDAQLLSSAICAAVKEPLYAAEMDYALDLVVGMATANIRESRSHVDSLLEVLQSMAQYQSQKMEDIFNDECHDALEELIFLLQQPFCDNVTNRSSCIRFFSVSVDVLNVILRVRLLTHELQEAILVILDTICSGLLQHVVNYEFISQVLISTIVVFQIFLSVAAPTVFAFAVKEIALQIFLPAFENIANQAQSCTRLVDEFYEVLASICQYTGDVSFISNGSPVFKVWWALTFSRPETGGRCIGRVRFMQVLMIAGVIPYIDHNLDACWMDRLPEVARNGIDLERLGKHISIHDPGENLAVVCMLLWGLKAQAVSKIDAVNVLSFIETAEELLLLQQSTVFDRQKLLTSIYSFFIAVEIEVQYSITADCTSSYCLNAVKLVEQFPELLLTSFVQYKKVWDWIWSDTKHSDAINSIRQTIVFNPSFDREYLPARLSTLLTLCSAIKLPASDDKRCFLLNTYQHCLEQYNPDFKQDYSFLKSTLDQFLSERDESFKGHLAKMLVTTFFRVPTAIPKSFFEQNWRHFKRNVRVSDEYELKLLRLITPQRPDGMIDICYWRLSRQVLNHWHAMTRTTRELALSILHDHICSIHEAHEALNRAGEICLKLTELATTEPTSVASSYAFAIIRHMISIGSLSLGRSILFTTATTVSFELCMRFASAAIISIVWATESGENPAEFLCLLLLSSPLAWKSAIFTTFALHLPYLVTSQSKTDYIIMLFAAALTYNPTRTWYMFSEAELAKFIDCTATQQVVSPTSRYWGALNIVVVHILIDHRSGTELIQRHGLGDILSTHGIEPRLTITKSELISIENLFFNFNCKRVLTVASPESASTSRMEFSPALCFPDFLYSNSSLTCSWSAAYAANTVANSRRRLVFRTGVKLSKKLGLNGPGCVEMKCNYCGAGGFNTKTKHAHIRKCHWTFKCEVCVLTFITEKRFSEHILAKHGENQVMPQEKRMVKRI
uniref:C2H2-type domain-containing protein n=1 Tax=Spongospora subterranea TaxID=70186 RepID=A0A0H5R0L2_9EUKA|eukprot:CRZ01289.1 hypothetical protein [Spongospora subterranea]